MEQHGKYYPMKEVNPDEHLEELLSKLKTTQELYTLFLKSLNDKK